MRGHVIFKGLTRLAALAYSKNDMFIGLFNNGYCFQNSGIPCS